MASLQSVASRLNVVISVEQAADGSVQLQEEEESVACVCPNVEWVFGDNLSAGTGTLYLTTRQIAWIGASASYRLKYQQVIMHAISRDTAAFAKPCVYLQLDDGMDDAAMMPDGDEDEEGSGSGSGSVSGEVAAEVRLVPSEEAKVDELFKALCDCAALNPDSDGEASGEGDFFFNEAEVMAGLDAPTRAALMAARLAGMGVEEEGAGEGLGVPGAIEEGEEGDEEMGEGGEELQALVGDDPSRFEDDVEDADDAAAAPVGNGHPPSS